MKCFYGPRLYKIFKGGYENKYKPNRLERWPDLVFITTQALSPLFYWMCPFLISYWIYNPNAWYKSMDLLLDWIGVIIGGAAGLYFARGVGRCLNKTYLDFLNDCFDYGEVERPGLRERVRHYDYDFSFFPTTYTIGPKVSFWEKYEIFRLNPFKTRTNMHLPVYKRIPLQLFGFLAAHTFGIALMYPGKIRAIQFAFRDALLAGRSTLVEIYCGQRSKVYTADENDIDVMIVDARRNQPNGHILVVCCEGNSGFYEIGIMGPLLEAGYSVLGYNRPGFGGSTGNPYPSQERHAIEGVIEFANAEYGFHTENIVLYGWSIGGYSATWAATRFPDIKCLVLDASFGRILPLGLNLMPDSWAPFVKEVIESYLNLNIVSLLAEYSGRVQIIRRLEDEIICLKPHNLGSNCGNELVENLIQTRHEHVTQYEDYPRILKQCLAMPECERHDMVAKITIPEEREILQLVNMYLMDVRGNHCDALKVSIIKDIISGTRAKF